jgi:hypothetical protein
LALVVPLLLPLPDLTEMLLSHMQLKLQLRAKRYEQLQRLLRIEASNAYFLLTDFFAKSSLPFSLYLVYGHVLMTTLTLDGALCHFGSALFTNSLHQLPCVSMYQAAITHCMRIRQDEREIARRLLFQVIKTAISGALVRRSLCRMRSRHSSHHG